MTTTILYFYLEKKKGKLVLSFLCKIYLLLRRRFKVLPIIYTESDFKCNTEDVDVNEDDDDVNSISYFKSSRKIPLSQL